MRRQSGFTLIELLVVIGITSVLLTLSAYAIRHYWFVKAIDGAAEEVESELRALQQRTIAESHPLVYGAWFKTGDVTGQWGILKFDPKDPSESTDDVCTQVGSPRSFNDGVVVSAVDFAPPVGVGTTCNGVAPAGAEKVFFYARGSATPGEVTLHHPLSDRSRTVTVSELTGRVDRQ